MSARGNESGDLSVRDKILKEALYLMASRGYEATSIQAVADAVGVRKQSLLYHFPSKEILHEAVIEALVSRWNDVLPKVMLAATGGRDRFEAVMRTVVEFFVEDPNRAKILLREVLDRPAVMQRILNQHSQVWSGAIRAYIEEGQQFGSVDPDLDPDCYILHITTLLLCGIATFETMSAFLRVGSELEGKSELERFIDEMMRIAQRSLFMKRPRQSPQEQEQEQEQELQ